MESDEETGVARIICDVFLPDGTPFMGDPDRSYANKSNVPKNLVTNILSDQSWNFPFPLDENGKPTVDPHDTAGYFDYSSDRAGAIRQAMSDAVTQMGVDVETIHHEVSPDNTKSTSK